MGLGTWADWVTAAVTFFGFGAAVWQLRLNHKESRTSREKAWREEANRREAMARAVGIKATWKPGPDGRPPHNSETISVDIEILNSGPYPIRNTVLHLATDDEHLPHEIVYGTILPGEHLKATHEAKRSLVTFGELSGGVDLLFTDTWDAHWLSSTSWRGLERREEPARIC
ncbi:hypothetical protein SLW73_02130 [Glutamicibacter protophormiae]|uniref:hypothetical protein n=1 Tax=Glutamicibacter protophormiae TaxID=37930 RepID=UPI002A82987D|nr:hypothetical protein [Glutamicibacter protophormiae]WPR65159.1 hypothetical protein SLW72_02130 [Glutamicibacter protophormiae]WPR68656.1 hypothetical protein SLW73_02130 [Glutamicibacter protophormiae]